MASPGNPPEERQATDVRQGEIILRTRRRRIIFLGGLAGGVLLALIVSIAAGAT